MVGNGEIEKMIDELPTKDIKMLTLMPFLANHIPFILKKLPSIKWIHSLTAGIELFFKIFNFCNNFSFDIPASKYGVLDFNNLFIFSI